MRGHVGAWGLVADISASASYAICALPRPGRSELPSGRMSFHPSPSPLLRRNRLGGLTGPNPRKIVGHGQRPPGSDQPATWRGAGAVTPGTSTNGVAVLQPTAASAISFTGEQVNAVPFARAGEALEVVPGLIVTQHSGEGKAKDFLRGFNLDHGTDLPSR